MDIPLGGVAMKRVSGRRSLCGAQPGLEQRGGTARFTRAARTVAALWQHTNSSLARYVSLNLHGLK